MADDLPELLSAEPSRDLLFEPRAVPCKQAMMAAHLHFRLKEPEAAERVALQALALCEEFGTPALAAVCRATLGRAMADLGGAAEGVALLRDAAKVLDERVTRLSITENLSWLAEALALDGKINDALGVTEDALRATPNGLVNRPEAFRIRGTCG